MGQDEIQEGYYRKKYGELEGIKEHAEVLWLQNRKTQPSIYQIRDSVTRKTFLQRRFDLKHQSAWTFAASRHDVLVGPPDSAEL
jgi:hypothetical protein